MTETVYHLPVPATIALIADLHNRPYFSVIQSLSNHRPEMICITGDLIYGGNPDKSRLLIQTQEYVLPFLRACRSIAPTFLSLGNHERTLKEEDLQVIRNTGCVLLDNSWITFNGLIIGGLTSHYILESRRYRTEKKLESFVQSIEAQKIKEPDTAWLSEFEEQDGYKILLCHHPEYYPQYLKERKFDLVLAGHAHGGQWRIGRQGIYAPGQGLFPGLTSGIHDGRLVISRGLSNPSPIPRWNNPPEFVYIQDGRALTFDAK